MNAAPLVEQVRAKYAAVTASGLIGLAGRGPLRGEVVVDLGSGAGFDVLLAECVQVYALKATQRITTD